MFAPGAARDDGGAAGGGGQSTIDGGNISTSGSCVLSPGVSAAKLISGEGCAGDADAALLRAAWVASRYCFMALQDSGWRL